MNRISHQSLRSSKSSNLLNALSVSGLVLISLLLVLVLNSASLVNPLLPVSPKNPNSVPGALGKLTIELVSNQNESDRLSNPTDLQLPVPALPAKVTPADNNTGQFGKNYLLVTNTTGVATAVVPADSYFVIFQMESLNVRVPVQVFKDNETLLTVVVLGSAYQVTYSEESNVIPTQVGVQADMYVELESQSPTTVANPREQVLLKMHEGATVGGYLVNATVVTQQPPSQGTQWLTLATLAQLNPVNVTQIYLTTWSYSQSISVRPVGPLPAISQQA